MKPNTKIAMQTLIKQIKREIINRRENKNLCSDTCRGCSIKLINYLINEVEDWEYRLSENEVPSFADINKLARTVTKIEKVLGSN